MMPLKRFLLRLGPPVTGTRGTIRGTTPFSPAGRGTVTIRPIEDAGDRQAAGLLAEACRNAVAAPEGADGARFGPAGVMAELVGRPGRAVHGWLAWRSPAAEHPPVGVITLVETGAGPQVRSSISCLLVHPATRRQGVATALVRRALADAHDRGRDGVWAETLSSWPAAIAFWETIAAEVGAGMNRQGAAHA